MNEPAGKMKTILRKIQLFGKRYAPFLGIFATVVSIITFCRSCGLERDQREIAYKVHAVSFQPRLKVIGGPKISEVNTIGRIDPDTFTKLLIPRATQDTVDVNLDMELRFKSRLKVTNIGNTAASLIAYACCDTTSDEPYLRKVLSNTGKLLPSGRGFFPPYFANELLPGAEDTTEIQFQSEIQFVNNERFTVHYLLLYENDIGQLFDTYYWAQYQFKPLIFPPLYKMEGRKILPVPFPAKIATRDFIELINTKVSYNTYSEDKTRKIEVYLDRQLEAFRRDTVESHRENGN